MNDQDKSQTIKNMEENFNEALSEDIMLSKSLLMQFEECSHIDLEKWIRTEDGHFRDIVIRRIEILAYRLGLSYERHTTRIYIGSDEMIQMAKTDYSLSRMSNRMGFVFLPTLFRYKSGYDVLNQEFNRINMLAADYPMEELELYLENIYHFMVSADREFLKFSDILQENIDACNRLIVQMPDIMAYAVENAKR